MAPEIALDAIQQAAGEPMTIVDPMCGSGTVLGVAMQRGHNAVGIDIDPLAVMMSRLTVTALDTAEMQTLAKSVVSDAERNDGYAPWGEDEETSKFVAYWFGKSQTRQLIALTTAIDSVEDASQKLALQMAVSRIIVTKSQKASLAADTSHSRPHRVTTTSEYDVFAGFGKSVVQLARLLSLREMSGSGRVELGDARTMAAIDDGAADLAVTSPPYLNALDYLRGHKLALVWFGHTIPELRQKRRVSIGAERAPDADSSEMSTAIVDIIESQAADPTVLKRPMLERFAQDCMGFASQLHRTVREGGKAVLVVGNSTLRGNYIRNSLITQKSMEHAGFTLIDQREREIPPNKRYMAIGAAGDSGSIAKRMRTEVVLTMER